MRGELTGTERWREINEGMEILAKYGDLDFGFDYEIMSGCNNGQDQFLSPEDYQKMLDLHWTPFDNSQGRGWRHSE